MQDLLGYICEDSVKTLVLCYTPGVGWGICVIQRPHLELEPILPNVSGRYLHGYIFLRYVHYITRTMQIREKGMFSFTECISDISLKMQYSHYLTEYLKCMELVCSELHMCP